MRHAPDVSPASHPISPPVVSTYNQYISDSYVNDICNRDTDTTTLASAGLDQERDPENCQIQKFSELPVSPPYAVDSLGREGRTALSGKCLSPLQNASAASPSLPLCPADVAERVARSRAPRSVTLAALGYATETAFAGAQRARLSAILDALPPIAERKAQRLAVVTRAFLEIPQFAQAVELGWSDLELFGLAWHAPEVRLAEQGLVSGLALSSLNSPKLVAIHADAAVIRCGSGAQLTYRRFTGNTDCAVPWWEIPAFCDPLPQPAEQD
jgi:hypothetical protein